MAFAIVDIETTGGYAASNGITEVAIYVFDGKKIIETYQTLINPGCHIPYYITSLTGINNEMVKHAPAFSEVAAPIYTLLEQHVFVAHNVNFDYSFLKHALAQSGYTLNTKKLCTIRLSRKVMPGLKSYGLGNICNYLGIEINGRHRAGGDAEATVKLFQHLLANGADVQIPDLIKRTAKEQVLPPNLPREQFDALPQTPGVYYFRDRKGKVVYVGKAINLKKRVSSHFSNNSPTRQRQNFLREIHHITYTQCESEAASIKLETREIKRLWPRFNQAQKHYEPLFGIVQYVDQTGFKRLGIQKVNSRLKAEACFSTYIDGFNVLKAAAQHNELCLRLTGVTKDRAICTDAACVCNNNKRKEIKEYNTRVAEAIDLIKAAYPNDTEQLPRFYAQPVLELV